MKPLLFSLLVPVAAFYFLEARQSAAQDEDPPQPIEERPQAVQQSAGPAPAPAPATRPLESPPLASREPPLPIPPPQPAPTIAAPAPHPKVAIRPRAEKGTLERATPAVEILRANASTPQAVARTDHRMPRAGRLGAGLMNGDGPVTVILRFDRSLGGKRLEIRASQGLSVTPPAPAVLLPPTGEAMLQVALAPEHHRGQITFQIENVRTVLPLMRAPAALVNAAEAVSAAEVGQ